MQLMIEKLQLYFQYPFVRYALVVGSDRVMFPVETLVWRSFSLSAGFPMWHLARWRYLSEFYR